MEKIIGFEARFPSTLVGDGLYKPAAIYLQVRSDFNSNHHLSSFVNSES